MLRWIKALDRVLKGEATRPEALRGGKIDLPLGGLSVVILLLGVVYGVCMGVYSIVTRWNTPNLYMGYQQLGASAVKVPMLFFLTLLVTLPSLYVFNALVGSRLSFTAVVRLLVAALGVIMAVLASFGTIIVFFSLSTTSYSFMVLLNVVMFALSGILGLGFLLQTLHRLSLAQAESEEPAPPSPLSEVMPGAGGGFGPDVGMVQPRPDLPPVATIPPVQPLPPGAYGYPAAAAAPPKPLRMPGALERLEGRAAGRNVRTVFRIWVIVFGLVGGQMAWMLRPFIGNPNVPFTFFRARQSNFFEAVYDRIVDLATPSWDHERGPHHTPGAPPSGQPSSQPSSQPSGRPGYGG